MKFSKLVPFALAAGAVLAAFSQADALQTTKAYKIMLVNVLVTPSPAPIVFLHGRARTDATIAALTRDPAHGPAQVASIGAWDVAPGAALLAATTSQAAPVPVHFAASPDPNAAYLRIVPHVSTLNANYGTTTYTCAFEVFTYYTNTYKLLDWGYGTSTATGTVGPFPLMNYPTASNLSWSVPDLGTSPKAYANSGAPGETSWTGAIGQSQQHCVNLTLTVPNSQPAGLFSASVQYSLYVTL